MSNFFNRMIVTVTVFALVSLAAAEDDRQPMEVLREGMNQGLAFLGDQTYRDGYGRAAQEARIRELTMTLFDFTTMSRMVLSSYWDDFTAAQQAAFVQAFRAFLQNTYLPILLERYDGERIEYLRQIKLSTSRARVEIRVLHRRRTIPVDVKMIRRLGKWRIYDVNAMGFSAVAIYRAQFRWLLGKETPAQVIERLQRSQGQPP